MAWPTETLTDEMRVYLLERLLNRMENRLRIREPDVDLMLRIERILRNAMASRLDPKDYASVWGLRELVRSVHATQTRHADENISDINA
jgi:hypothetical protein